MIYLQFMERNQAIVFFSRCQRFCFYSFFVPFFFWLSLIFSFVLITPAQWVYFYICSQTQWFATIFHTRRESARAAKYEKYKFKMHQTRREMVRFLWIKMRLCRRDERKNTEKSFRKPPPPTHTNIHTGYSDSSVDIHTQSTIHGIKPFCHALCLYQNNNKISLLAEIRFDAPLKISHS